MANPFYTPDTSERTSKLMFTNAPAPGSVGLVTYANYPFNGLWSIQTNSYSSYNVTSPPFGPCFYQWSARALSPTNDKGNFYCSGFVVVTDSVCLPQTVASATNLAVNGRFASGGSVTFNWGLGNTINKPGQNITARSSQNETATLTVTGTDTNSAGLTDTITFAGGKLGVQSNPSTKIFVTVASVVSSAALNGIVMLGHVNSPGGTYAAFNQSRTFYRNYLKANNASIAQAAAGIGYPSSYYTPLAIIAGPTVDYSVASVISTLGSNPLTSTAGANQIIVAQTAHGYTAGQFVNTGGAASMPSNIPSTDFNNIVTVDRVIDANTWVALSTLFAAATATGGGAAITVQTLAPALIQLHGANPNPPMSTVAIGSTQINVNLQGHGLISGETIVVSGLPNPGSGVGGIPAANIDGARVVTGIIDANNFSFNASGVGATSVGFGGSNAFIGVQPLLATNGSSVLTVRMGNGAPVSPSENGTGVSAGDVVVLAGWAGVGGLTSGQINGTRTITGTPTANSYTVTAGANATSTASGGGTGTATFTYNLTIGQYQLTDAVQVMGVNVGTGTAGAVSVGGIYDGVAAVAASQHPTIAGNLTLTSPVVTLSQDQYLTITSTGNDSNTTFLFNAINSIGQSWTYSVKGPNTGTITVPYNALLPLVTNTTNPLLDVIALPDALAGGTYVVLDYEVGDRRSSVQALQYLQTFAAMCQSAPLFGKRSVTLFTDALNASSAKINGYSNWMMAQLSAIPGFTPTILTSPSNNIPDINQQFQFMQGLLGGVSAPAKFNYTLQLDLGPNTPQWQAVQMRQLLETYGYSFCLPWRDNSVAGNSSAYDHYNLLVAACAFGNAVPRTLLAVM